MESPAPASAPPTLAESMVARERPTAPISSAGGMVSPMSELRMTRSFGRTMPLSPAITSTQAGASQPVAASSSTTLASPA